MELDLSGHKCPMPVILAHRCLADLGNDAVLVVVATDPLACYDFPDYCRSTGHILLQTERTGNVWRFHIQKHAPRIVSAG